MGKIKENRDYSDRDLDTILEIVRGLTKYVGQNLEKEKPGPTVYTGAYGDYKRRVDKLANSLVEKYLEKHSKKYKIPVVCRTEHKSKWLIFDNGKKEEIPPDNVFEGIKEGYVAIDMDEVDGTKNLQNKDRFTTAIAFEPEQPNMKGLICSSVYRWSGEEYYHDGEKSYYYNIFTKESGELPKAERIDKIDNTIKIKGCFIAPYLWMWNIIADEIIEAFDLNEKEMPCFCSTGATTEDLLSTVLDRSIAIDPRALDHKAQRKPYAHDIAPPASIVLPLGVDIRDFDLRKFNIDLVSPNISIPYCAIPQGNVGKKILGLLPDIKKRIEEIANK